MMKSGMCDKRGKGARILFKKTGNKQGLRKTSNNKEGKVNYLS